MEDGGRWAETARSTFRREYGRDAQWAASAPGRVNLIGEHTDYNGGLALPCAIDREALVLLAPRDDFRVRVSAWDLAESADFEVSVAQPQRDWSDYVRGIFFALAERGVETSGFDLGIVSRVPMNAGLSSSAALGVAVAAGVSQALGLEMGPRDWAHIAHRSESGFVGVACGLLDHFASALGRQGHALRMDCRSEEVEAISVGGEPFGFLLVHSGVERRLADGTYGMRVDECRRALDAAVGAGLAPQSARVLSDLAGVDREALEAALDPLLFRRARHVLSENERVEAFCQALAAGDLQRLGSLLAEAQASLAEDYAVSTPEIDWLCAFGPSCEGVLGSRLTGAGLGGFTLHLVLTDSRQAAEEQIGRGFEARFGSRPQSLWVQPSQGARVEALGD
ncbi:MAG: galactokinase [Myxococcota bacterium]|jgi:galactokinase|nr:galactokinase [Myxococcota bacterium]